MTSMSTSALQENIPLLFDREFDDVRRFVFGILILDAVDRDGEAAGDEKLLPRKLLDDSLRVQLGFTVRTGAGERTHEVFRESLQEALDNGWVKITTVAPRGDEQEYIHLLAAGKERLEELDRKTHALIQDCYVEFCRDLYQRLIWLDRRDSSSDEDVGVLVAQNVRQESDEEIQHSLTTPFGDKNALWKGFQQFLNTVVPEFAYVLISQTFSREIAARPAAMRQRIDKAFDLTSISDSASKDKYLRAINYVCGEYHPGSGQFQFKGPIRHWYYARAYERLFQKTWPDIGMQERLNQQLECSWVYIDTSVLIAALAEDDLRNKEAREILSFLASKKIRYFWLPNTEEELQGNLALSRSIVQLLTDPPRPSWEVLDVLELTNPPGFVRTYFGDHWKSWARFERDIRERYELLKEQSQVIEFMALSSSLDSAAKEERDRRINHYTGQYRHLLLRERRMQTRHPVLISHDAYALAIIKSMREMSELFINEKCRPIYKGIKKVLGEYFWLVTFDSSLQEIVGTGNNNVRRYAISAEDEENASLTLLYDTIMLFLDPHLVSRTLKGKFEAGELPPSWVPRVGRRLPRTLKELEDTIDRAKEKLSLVKNINQVIEDYNNERLRKYGSNS